MKILSTKVCAIFLLLLTAAVSAVADPPPTELLSLGRMNDAVSILTSRDDAGSLNLLSRAYFAMERWDDAVKYGERAVNLAPENASYHLWLGRAYGRKAQAANPFAAAGLARKARNEFERAVQLDPASVPAHLDLAQYYTEAPSMMGGGLDKARNQASQVQNYDAGMAHLILARVAEKDKQFAEAENQYRQAIQAAKNPADLWLQLADFYRRQGRPADMQGAVRAALKQPKPPAESYFEAARELYLGSRDLPQAKEYVQKYLSSGELVESAPAFHAHYLLGQLNEKTGNNGAAASEYQASLSLASAFAPARKALDHVQ